MRNVNVLERRKTPLKHKDFIPFVKHAGGSNMVGPVLLHLGQHGLLSLMAQLILNYISEFYKKMPVHLSVT